MRINKYRYGHYTPPGTYSKFRKPYTTAPEWVHVALTSKASFDTSYVPRKITSRISDNSHSHWWRSDVVHTMALGNNHKIREAANAPLL